MEEVDSRFLHLLQPIRDLTQNWEVDVAAQLGEYLEELDHICISFDNGKTTMNFMEAALLIQGSACIYSRKVEYLYMLVCQTLDGISNKRREKLPTSLGPDGRDADATFGNKEQEFLSLDDIPRSSQDSVNMRRSQQLPATNIVPLTPMSLVAPEETEKKENPLLSRRGEVLASRRDFRMNTSTLHASGTFLLELARLSPSHLGTDTGPAGPGLQQQLSATVSPVRALSFSQEPGAAGSDDDDAPEAPGGDMEVTPVPTEHIEAQRSSPRIRGCVLRERFPSRDPKTHSQEEPSPWQSLDPFGDSEEKPFRKGRPFLLPQGLEAPVGGKRKRRALRKLQDFSRWFSAVYSSVPPGRRGRRRGPTFADLEVLYWRHFKERMMMHRKLRGRGEPQQELEQERERERGADGAHRGVPGEDFGALEDEHPEEPEEPGEGALEPPEPGYEELVRRNVELFMASSQKFAQESELSQRIRLWEERVEPLLQEQESRVPFDVRAYGLALTARCPCPGRWHSLASLVAGQPPFEVCRYLLASLQLANDAEVELAQDAGLEAALDTARLRPLSARPAHERFQNFLLPSQSQPSPQ
ncbi:condensin-2 complex subunit H2 [Poecile atricapillus]|uniref:condensin-2 complex subunit H2 n=1 Tax=Poecile atricapillus TaxID=48891 RepID=UPI002739D35B|nr:condensin-2 complex subunit H2 [Poecile atricapillus]